MVAIATEWARVALVNLLDEEPGSMDEREAHEAALAGWAATHGPVILARVRELEEENARLIAAVQRIEK